MTKHIDRRQFVQRTHAGTAATGLAANLTFASNDSPFDL